MFSSGPKYQKLTTNLRLAINRLKLLEKKKSEMAIKSRREIAEYMKNGKEDRARIRVEHIIREDYLVEALEIIEMYCDLLLARMGVIQTSKTLDEGLEEPIASIIWVTPRLQGDVQELVAVSEQLGLKYGKEFVTSCRSNGLNNVNEKLLHKLGIHAPPKVLVEKYMEEIAKSFNIPYISPAEPECLAGDLLFFSGNECGNGGMSYPPEKAAGVPPLPDIGPFDVGQRKDIGFMVDNNPPPSYTSIPPVQPQFQTPYPMPHQFNGMPSAGPTGVDTVPILPAVPKDTTFTKDGSGSASTKAAGNDEINFDDLSKRFEELKKKR